MELAVRISEATRPPRRDAMQTDGQSLLSGFIECYVAWGAGPRASQYMLIGAKARAILEGRESVSREDIVKLAYPVLRHRIITNFHAEAEGIDSRRVVDAILKWMA